MKMNTYIFGWKTRNNHGHAVLSASSFDEATHNVRKKLKHYDGERLEIDLEEIIPISTVFVVSANGNKLIKE